MSMTDSDDDSDMSYPFSLDGNIDEIVRPMDARFLEHILPTLSHGPWPALEQMAVRGVGGRTLAPLQNSSMTSLTQWKGTSLVVAE